MKLTIDASVWVSAFVASDVHHEQSDQVLETCLALRAKVFVPEIVLLEVAAGVARILQHDGQGQIAAKRVERFPDFEQFTRGANVRRQSALVEWNYGRSATIFPFLTM